MEGSKVTTPGHDITSGQTTKKSPFTINVQYVILRIKITSQASTVFDIPEILTNIHPHATYM